MRILLERIKTSGLKARDIDLRLGRVTAVVGPNGSGKTGVMHALQLLARGKLRDPLLPATPDGVMALARGDRLSIEAWIRLPSGKTATVRRTWTRGEHTDSRGVTTLRVSEEIGIVGWPGSPKGLRGAQAHLSAWLGGLEEAWEPLSLRDGGTDATRRRLLAVCPRDEIDVASLVPPDAPAWARPDHGTEDGDARIDPLDYTTITRSRCATRLTEARREHARLIAAAAELEAGLPGVLSTVVRVEDPAPIQARLAALREELQGGAQRAAADARAADLRERLRAAEEALGLAKARAAEAAGTLAPEDAQRMQSEGHQARARLEQARAQVRHLEAKLGRMPEEPAPDVEAARAEVDAAKAEAEAVWSRYAEAERAEAQAEARAGALGEGSPLPACPSCGADLLAHLAEARAVARAEAGRLAAIRRQSAEEADEAEARLRARKRALDDALEAEGRARARTALTADLEQAQAEALAEEEEAARWPSPEAAAAQIERARAHRDAARDVTRLSREAEALEIDAEIVAAEAEEITARPAAEVQAEIAAAEVELAQLGERNAASRGILDARAEAERVAAEIAWLEGFARRLQVVEADLLAKTKGWLERSLSETMGGARVEVALYDERGKPACRILVDGVPFAARSDGERAITLAALLVPLARRSDAPWRPLLVDRLECLDLGNRAGLLAAVVGAVEAGDIDQAILAGCPDTLPRVEGVEVIELGDRGEEAAA